MKLIELFEDEYKPKNITDIFRTSNGLDELINKIETECSDIVEAYRMAHAPLYRGISESNSELVLDVKIRPDREPRQMDIEWHNKLHAAFLEYGLKATRKNSIFCTTRKDIADDWGKTYMVFPRNGWTSTVFEGIKDDYAFNDLRYIRHQIHSAKISSPHDMIKFIASKMAEFGPKSLTQPHQMAKVIEEKYLDILITGSSYIAVDAKSPAIVSKILNGLKITDSTPGVVPKKVK